VLSVEKYDDPQLVAYKNDGIMALQGTHVSYVLPPWFKPLITPLLGCTCAQCPPSLQ